MGGETDSDVLFLIYTSSTAVGVENNSPSEQWVAQRFFWSQTSCYATSLSDRIRQLFISLLPDVRSSRATGVVTWVFETHYITMNSLSNAIYSLEKANLSPSW